MVDECKICINDNVLTFCYCSSCNNKHCVECLFTNECKCCYCSYPINPYKILMSQYSESLLELCIERLSRKINNAHHAYPKIFILEILFKDWLFSKNMLDLDIINNIVINFKTVLKCILTGSLHNCKESLRYLLTFNTDKRYLVIKHSDQAINASPINYDTDGEIVRDYEKIILKDKELRICNMYKNNELSRIIPMVIQTNDVKPNPDVFFYFLSLYTKPIYDIVLKNLPDCSCNKVSCEKCNTSRCRNCLSFDHKECEIKDNDLDSIKLCPVCKNLVYKESGCDDMWCINCKNFFSWRQGIIRTDDPHNPDHQNYYNLNNKILQIKRMLFREILNDDAHLSDEESFLLDYFLECDFYEVDCKYIIRSMIIPKFLTQVLAYQIVDCDVIYKRDFNTIITILTLCDNFKKTVMAICGGDEKNFQDYWNTIVFENFKIDVSHARITYLLL